MTSQDTRLSKFEVDFKQQQSEMTNKIDTVLEAIPDRIVGALLSDTVKKSKLNTSSVLSARSYPTEDPQCSTHIHGSINTITIHPKQQNDSRDSTAKEEEREREGDPDHTNTITYIEEQRDAPLLERKDITIVVSPPGNGKKGYTSPDKEMGVRPMKRKISRKRIRLVKFRRETVDEGEVTFKKRKRKEIDAELLMSYVYLIFRVLLRATNTACRKAHLLEDKQIPSVGVFEEVTWMAFRGNTRDLGSFGEDRDEITDLYQILKEVLLTERGDGIAGIKQRRRDPSSDGVEDLVTASGRSRLNEDLESST
ncbi:hypothetical protein Tco_0665530 [Tanacetum coccineum]